jgi:hypothetical protein
LPAELHSPLRLPEKREQAIQLSINILLKYAIKEGARKIANKEMIP